MTLTIHGHHIPNTPTNDESKTVPKVRCGGTDICSRCKKDVAFVQSIHGTEAED